MLRPFFGFYGGKWRDALKHYPAPEYGTIVEPFAGSAGYSVRHADRRVVLAEKDPILAGVWQYLIAASPSDIRHLPDIEDGQSTHDLDVDPRARALIGLWLNRAVSRPRSTPSAWMRSGIRPGSFWGSRVRETIASQVDAIRHWTVLNCSYEEVGIVGAATWFIDPPYAGQGKHYRFGSDDLDYAALGFWCQRREGQVIVCENEGADWLPFTRLTDIKTTRSARSVEAVWIG